MYFWDLLVIFLPVQKISRPAVIQQTDVLSPYSVAPVHPVGKTKIDIL